MKSAELTPNKQLNISHLTAWSIGLLILASFLFLYKKPVYALMETWDSRGVYSYGYLIPFLSLYMAWTRRDELLKTRISSNYVIGALLLFISFSVYLAGYIGGINLLQEITIPIAIAGVILLILGIHHLKILWLPVAYLFFMIPVWDFFINRIHYPYQIFTAVLGTQIIDLLGVPVFREGTYIELPNIRLEVAKACSGINNLMAMVTLAIPVVYIILKKWKAKMIFLCVAVIIAALANCLRVALIGVFFYYGIIRDIHGPMHSLHGIFVAIVCYILLFGGLWLYSRKRSDVFQSSHKNENSNISASRSSSGKSPIVLSVSIVVLFLLLGSYIQFYKPASIPLKTPLAFFPSQLDEWSGRNINHTFNIYKELGADSELNRMYHAGSGEDINFYVGYFEFQRQGKEFINYQTQEFYNNASRLKINIDNDFIEVNKMIRKNGNSNELILLWHDLNGRVTSDRNLTKLYTIWDAITKKRTNGAIIILLSEFNEMDELPEALARSEDFVRKIYPLLENYLP